MKNAPVKVIDMATGEVKAERAADSFKPRLPSKPTKPDPHAWRDFWGAHSECLTREERRKIAAGKSKASIRPLEHKPAWGNGDLLEVARNLTAKVVKVGWTRDGYVTHFDLIDERPLFMARTMGGGGVPWVDKDGFPVPYSEATKQAARVDGAYTRSASQGITEAGDVMDDELHQKLHPEVGLANSAKQAKGKKRVDIGRIEERLAEARAKNWRSTIRHLEGRLSDLRRKKAA